MGVFDPQFDIAGPVLVNYSSTTPQGYNNVDGIFVSAIEALDSSIDFSQYDGDGDGIVDMIYFIVAGYTANFTGNNSGYLWPHQYYMYYYTSKQYDNVYLGRYSCSGEIYGWEDYGYTDPDGIGTIVHEFTHALGIMDLYDTDYGTNGAANDPGEWDVMSGGSYLNDSRTPAGFSIWERYRLGFAEPEQITEMKAGYTLEPVNTSNQGYWIQSPNENEFFMIENRQKTGWDAYLPGHGMLVARVEYDEDQWWNNTINADASHMYYELLRAGNGVGASDSDPFPGTNNVTALNNLTTPSLRTWSGLDCDYGLNNIAENNGIITFGVVNGDGTSPGHGYELGDVNHDGFINIADVTSLIDYLLNSEIAVCSICADVVNDGEINIADVTALIDMLLTQGDR
jgi:M6 family metalloprotease-like protein